MQTRRLHVNVDFTARQTTNPDIEKKDESNTMNRWIASLPRPYTKWCAYLLLALTPGSFVFLPAIWFIRWRRAAQAQPLSAPPPKACGEALRP
jgi:hypothetical protein